jgi:hypothetical protein
VNVLMLPEFFELLVSLNFPTQGVSIDIKHVGGLGDIVIVPGQDLHDEFHLHLLQGVLETNPMRNAFINKSF